MPARTSVPKSRIASARLPSEPDSDEAIAGGVNDSAVLRAWRMIR
jgi:hypothetical protein